MLDQGEWWVTTDGRKRKIVDLPEVLVVGMLDYSLANAKYLRDVWAMGTQGTYDPEERARRWMLDRPAIRAMLRQLVSQEKLRIEHNFKEATNEQED